MRSSLACATLAVLVGCSPSPPVDPAAHRAEIAGWRAERLERLQAPDGWLTLTALHWLEEGTTTLGSDPSVDLPLPAGAVPLHAGAIEWSAQGAGGPTVRIAPDPAAPVQLGETAVPTEGIDWVPSARRRC